MEHLLFGDHSAGGWFSPFQSVRDLLYRDEHVPTATETQKPHDAARKVSSVIDNEPKYVIDPITNRKVPKVAASVVFPPKDASVEVPASDAPAYKPQFAAAHNHPPIFNDGPPPRAELKKYDQVETDLESWNTFHDEHSAPNLHQPMLESEEYEKSHSVPGQEQVSWHANDGLLSSNDSLAGFKGSTVSTSPTSLEHQAPLNIYSGEPNVVQPKELQQYEPFLHNRVAGISEPSDADGKDASAILGQHVSTAAELRDNRNRAPFNVYSGEPNVVEPSELEKYTTFQYNEPDGKALAGTEEGHNYNTAEVGSYQAFRYNEPDGKPPATSNTEAYVDLHKYQVASADLEGTQAPSTDEDTPRYLKELRQYQSFGYSEPDGSTSGIVDATAQSVEAFDQEQRAGRQLPYIELTEQERAEDLDLLRASDIRSAFELEPPSKEQSTSRNKLETSMSGIASVSDAEDQEAAASVQAAKEHMIEGKQLTGNYVRDFPEEFARSWASLVTPEPTGNASTASPRPLESALDRQNKQPLQPSLDRQPPARVRPSAGLPESYAADSFSNEPQGLQTSYEKEVGSKTQPVLATEYGDLSEVKYAPSASTQAEVTLRLSDADFAQQITSLQAQGYEIASGRGDVLVLRKGETSSPSLNPIDKTGSTSRTFPIPPTGRFASPTGFVNYELPSEVRPAKHGFVSGIDVRREEPVFSGGQKRDGGREKKSLPKRMVVGAVWLAGVSYAVGVVSEYFRTGGMDGTGPRGL